MPVLNDADALRLGTQTVDKMYLGSNLVWQPTFKPNAFPGLVTWLRAEDYAAGTWPNRGSGAVVRVVGTPVMTAGVPQNGRPTIRFKANEGRVRGDWPYPVDDWTVLYTVRWVGPGVGRGWTVCYPPSNLLVGMHTTGQDTFYPTWLGPNGGGASPWGTAPGPWKLYEADSSSSVGTMGFYINGTVYGRVATGSAQGLTNGWGLSGYDQVSTTESMDIEVGELIIYNRKLLDAERKQVEDYLQTRWGLPKPYAYDPDTTAYLTATGLSEPTYGHTLDALVKNLKTAGLWTKMNAIYPFIGGTAALHQWNLKDPRDLDAAYRLTYSNSASTTHSTALGYRPNAQGQNANGGYADTHFIPLGVLTQDSTHLSWYSLQDTPAADRAEFGAFNWGGMATSRFHIIARYTGVNAYYYGMSENASTNVPSPAASGLFVTSRTGPTTTTPYRNGVKLGSSSEASVALPDRPLWLGAINNFNNRSDIPVGFASIGSGLNDQNVTDLYNIVQAYQTALSRQV
jgi:hypothetical protein